MDTLYPKDYVKTEAVAPTKPTTTALKTFIKGLVKTKPKRVAEIIAEVDAKYIATNDEQYHFLANDIEAVCQEVDEEFRSVVKEPVEEPILLEPK